MVDLTVTAEPRELSFVPAVSRSYYMSAYTEYIDNVLLELVDPETGAILDRNADYPAFTGRHADQWADSGNEPDLDHATGMDVDLRQGRRYLLRVSPEDPDTVGDRATVQVSLLDTSIDIMVLWAIFSVALVVLALLGLIVTSRRT
jgi:hypothetical protein